MGTIGILCGIKSEAKIASKIVNSMVGCSAARPDRARALAQLMIDKGATRLLSFGLAGGISPELETGDLLIGTSVMTARGAWEADAALNGLLVDRLPQALCVSVWGCDHIAATPEEKALILRRTGCMSIDMESHVVAQMAQDNGIPFNVVRAISDPYNTALPPAARVPLMEDGGVDFTGVIDSLKKTPSQLPAMAKLGFATFRALRALRHAITVIEEME